MHRLAAQSFLAMGVLLVAACSSGSAPAEPTGTAGPQPSATPTGSKGAGLHAEALLQNNAFAEPIGSGSGGLESVFSSSLIGMPEGARSVSFTFVCLGGGEVTLKISSRKRPAKLPCNGSFLMDSIKITDPEDVGFEASTDAQSGEYAYGFYPEKP